METFYFGCWTDMGHHLHDEMGRHLHQGVIRNETLMRPEDLDGTFVPQNFYQNEQFTYVFHVRGWTLLSMWDRSIDSRPGSNCMFLVPRIQLTEDQMWTYAEQKFSFIADRLLRRRGRR